MTARDLGRHLFRLGLGLGDACTIAAGLDGFSEVAGLAGWVTALTGSVDGLIIGPVSSCSELTAFSVSGIGVVKSSAVSMQRSERISSMPSSTTGLSVAVGELI